MQSSFGITNTLKMRLLLLATNVGLMLSATITIYSSVLYFVLFGAIEEAITKAPGPDVVAAKLKTDLPEIKEKKLILDELKDRQDHAAKLRATVSRAATDARAHVIHDVLLWLGAFIIFAVLRLKLGSLPRVDNTQGHTPVC
jgi:hypothetical protein